MGLLEVPDLLWGRAGRGRESWDGALLPLSACDADRKGLLCGHSWGPGLQEERAAQALLSQAPGPCGRRIHDAGVQVYGPPVTIEKVAFPPHPRALAGVPRAGGSLDC